MEILWAGFVIFMGLVAWLGQLLCAVSPKLGARLGLAESEVNVDEVFFADARGEAIWDSLILWTLPLAGVLFMLQQSSWPYLALVGGGSYLYFSGRGMITRRVMQRRGIRIGTRSDVKVAYVFLGLWAIAALSSIFLATNALI